MNEQLVKEVLEDQANQEWPGAPTLWPGVRDRIGAGAGRQSARSQRPLMSMPVLKPLLAVGVFALLLAVAAMSWLQQPAPASAAEIIARSEQAANAPRVKSFHGTWSSRQRNDASESFFGSHNETWYLAPSSSRSEGRSTGHDGQEETSLLVRDEKMIWLYLSGDVNHSGHNQVILKDLDNSIPVFGASDLASLTGTGWLSDWYVPELVGNDEVLGRKAYILEFTLKPQDQWPPNHRPSKRASMRYWVDQQAYFVLKIEGWDVAGNELVNGGFTSFQIDAPVDHAHFTFAPPAGAQILDTRLASGNELDALWKQMAGQAPFGIFRPTSWLSEAREGRPYYSAAQGILTQGFPRANPLHKNSFEVQMMVITQEPASKKDVQGTGESVKVGNTTGLYAKDEYIQTLSFEREGTRITLSLPVTQGGIDMKGRMVQFAESLEFVRK